MDLTLVNGGEYDGENHMNHMMMVNAMVLM